MVFQLFNIVGGEILTFPDTLTTQGLSLWCFNIVIGCTRIHVVGQKSATGGRAPPAGRVSHATNAGAEQWPSAKTS